MPDGTAPYMLEKHLCAADLLGPAWTPVLTSSGKPKPARQEAETVRLEARRNPSLFLDRRAKAAAPQTIAKSALANLAPPADLTQSERSAVKAHKRALQEGQNRVDALLAAIQAADQTAGPETKPSPPSRRPALPSTGKQKEKSAPVPTTFKQRLEQNLAKILESSPSTAGEPSAGYSNFLDPIDARDPAYGLGFDFIPAVSPETPSLRRHPTGLPETLVEALWPNQNPHLMAPVIGPTGALLVGACVNERQSV